MHGKNHIKFVLLHFTVYCSKVSIAPTNPLISEHYYTVRHEDITVMTAADATIQSLIPNRLGAAVVPRFACDRSLVNRHHVLPARRAISHRKSRFTRDT